MVLAEMRGHLLLFYDNKRTKVRIFRCTFVLGSGIMSGSKVFKIEIQLFEIIE